MVLKVTTIIGARPQFIKAAVVSRSFREHRPDVHESIVHTGQHYDANMSDVFFDELDIPRPNHHLGIGGGTHGQNTGRMIEAIEAVLLKDKPDSVLVFGDTDSTLAGALAAVKLHIPVAHVEAGLRSFNRRMPEEINRVLTDHVAHILFTPTDTATHNLANEGITGTRVQQVGDVMYDAALYYRHRAQRPAAVKLDGGFILTTIHRAESTDDPVSLGNIISGLNEIASETPVILPLHPRTRKLLALNRLDTRNITLLEPVGYLQMVWLLQQCKLVVTDSGGLQKEAFFFGKHCITIRNETEWVELLESGWNVVVGTVRENIVCAVRDVANRTVLTGLSLYGDGMAGRKVADGLQHAS
jgi:UDP-GlcNAc3NAcA epimerase